jgi:hypothetical protein
VVVKFAVECLWDRVTLGLWIFERETVRPIQWRAAMNVQTAANTQLNIAALGWGLSAALFILFLICLIAALLFPDLPASQGWTAWIALFSVSPITSVRVWIDGIGFSLVFGWVTAVVLGSVYNRLVSHS